ncbi:hypothetical protein [uncultured Psychroserpens sp.]|uniref:hypothetical protein n=1 Tax=uncultured Psychroserpens sp. TaxID=255436 RepID=UPI00263596FB|nr:hypothetical protein [uncultured Psychroserpens sp.]
MKRHLKTLTRLIAFTSIVFFTSCEKEEIVHYNETKVESRVKSISLGELYDKIGYTDTYKAYNRFFDTNDNALNRISNNCEAQIITDDITMIEYDYITSYILKIDTETENNEFYNLVFHVNNSDGIVKSNIIKYTPSLDWLLDMSQPFKGTMHMMDNDIFSLEDMTNALSRNSLVFTCVTSITWQWECSANNNHSPADTQTPNPDTPGLMICEVGGNQLIINVTYGDCPEGFEAGDSTSGGIFVSPNVAVNHGTVTPGSNGTGTGTGNNGGDVSDGSGTGLGDLDGNTFPVKIKPLQNPTEAALIALGSIVQSPVAEIEPIDIKRARIKAVGLYFLTLTGGDENSPFVEFNEALDTAANNESLSAEDLDIMGQKTKAAYNQLINYASAIEGISDINELQYIMPQHVIDQVEINITETTILPEVKSLSQSSWPQNAEEWTAMAEIMGQFLVEIGLALIPGSSIVDVVGGLDEGDYWLVTAGIAGLVIDAFGGVILKTIAKAGKAIYKSFKIFKLAYKYLAEIRRGLTAGLKTVLEGDTVKILDDADNLIARIYNNILTFKYTGFGGDIVTKPNKTTTVIGKWVDNVDGGGTSKVINSGLSKSGENVGGINALSFDGSGMTEAQQWLVNQQWLDDAIVRGDDIRVISNPLENINKFKVNTNGQFVNSIGDVIPESELTSQGVLSFFGKEIEHLENAGYVYDVITKQWYLP